MVSLAMRVGGEIFAQAGTPLLQREASGRSEGGESWQTEGCFQGLHVGGEIRNFDLWLNSVVLQSG